MLQDFQLSASRLLKQCGQNISPVRKIVNSPKKVCALKQIRPIKQKFKQLNKISPQQQVENNRIIQKLRRNAKKKEKEVVIRKTDLGQNQMIFTKEQIDKLQQIDQYQMLGLEYRQPKPIQLPITNQDNINADEILRNSASNKKFFTVQDAKQQISSYLSWVDLKSVKNPIISKSKSKILKFQERQPSAQTVLLKNFHLTANQTLGNYKILLKKSKSGLDIGFLNSISPNSENNYVKKSQKQRLTDLTNKVNKTIQHKYADKDFIYMTQDRKQALYQCQMLRKVKKQMGPKFYKRIQLTFGNKKDEQQKQNVNSNKENSNHVSSNYNHSYGANNIHSINNIANKLSQSQADKVLQKNRNRIKQQRKRVIQKLIC